LRVSGWVETSSKKQARRRKTIGAVKEEEVTPEELEVGWQGLEEKPETEMVVVAEAVARLRKGCRPPHATTGGATQRGERREKLWERTFWDLRVRGKWLKQLVKNSLWFVDDLQYCLVE
jgi:hypothetical protein